MKTDDCRENSLRTTSFEDLIVWQRAMDLVEEAYALARRLPAEERLSLADQMRRAAVSVPANIAEGHGRAHRREFLYFLSIARASLKELQTHLLIARRVGYASVEDLNTPLTLCEEVSRMLRAMSEKLAAGTPEPPTRSTLHAQPAR